MSRFSTYSAQRRRALETVTLAELQSRATAAARMSLRGQSFDAEDRADAAAEIVWRILEGNRPTGHGRPADVLAWIDTADRMHSAGRVPAEWGTFSRMFGIGANLRRSLEARRDRDKLDALRRAQAGEGFDAFVPAPAVETGGTPTGARRSAVEMLRALGLMDSAKRHGRMVEVTPTGPLWTVAYTAARASGTLDAEALAAELDLSRAAHRKHLERAPDRIPAAQAGLAAHLWADALHMPDGGVALKPSRSRTLSHDIGDRDSGPRAHLASKDHAPCSARVDKRIIRKATVDHRPQWARTLDTGTTAQQRTAKRLAAAAAIRRERDSARTDSERARLRLSVGVSR